jgi:hypothetical protein
MDVIKYIIEANLSFKHVENEGFRHFILKQTSRVVVKSATTYSRGKLPIFHDSVKISVNNDLVKHLPECEGVSFTTDCWTSRNQDSCISFTCHFVDAYWNMQRYLLNCHPYQGSVTAVRIIDAHIWGVRGGGRYETAPPRQIFKKRVNKNAIKRKIGGPPPGNFS